MDSEKKSDTSTKRARARKRVGGREKVIYPGKKILADYNSV